MLKHYKNQQEKTGNSLVLSGEIKCTKYSSNPGLLINSEADLNKSKNKMNAFKILLSLGN